ncbi:hypothetical protein LY78DRAFT_322025 [Colletotrichum sublineola]|nr:hypothetical protein LY78DRAFT_322025 [Colletotrichum sublineola]
MGSDIQISGSGHKSSSKGCKGSRRTSSASAPASGPDQQQQVSRTLAQHVDSDRHPWPILSQSHHSNNHHASDTGSRVGSWNSTTGSANDGHGDPNDDYRSYDVRYTRQQRQDYAWRLQGPPRPPSQRPTPEEQLRDYDDRFGGYQPTATAPTHYSDRVGQLPAAFPYPRDLDSDFAEMLRSEPSRDSSRSKRSSSHKTSKHHHKGK